MPVAIHNRNPCSRRKSNSSSKGSWCGRRTGLEKVLLFIAAVLLAATIALAIAFGVTSSANKSGDSSPVTKPDDSTCMTTECVQTAARMLNAMDQTVKPCDDFFEYACGTWNKKNVIPDDRPSYNTFGKLRDELQVILKDMLEKPVDDEDSDATIKSKNVFQSCMNESYIEERSHKPAQDLIVELGGWPVLNVSWSTWNESTFDWLSTVSKLRLYNNRVLLNQWVSSDDKNSSTNIIQVDQAALGMPSRDYLLKGREDKNVKAYEDYAVGFVMLLDEDADKSYVEKEIGDMIDFEIELANITIPQEDRRDTEALYNKWTIDFLQKNISGIDWLKYLNDMFNEVGTTLTPEDEVVVYAPAYFRKLVPLIERTPKRLLSNYLTWRIMSNRASSLTKDFRDIRQDYVKILYGTASDRSRWRQCVSYANDHFGMAVGKLFVNKAFDESAKEIALEMIGNIREAFNELLEEVDWMDTETREVAREKANAISEKIGYPNYIMNSTALDKDYAELTIEADKYFENVLSVIRHTAKENLRQLGKPVDKTKWSTTPAVVNAFYSSTKNQIMFPAGILQPPFYYERYPKSLNYGGIGMVIGHEITHGFDDRGRTYDKDGNLRQWWSPRVVENFKERAQCIINQYGNYTVKEIDMNLNGINTQGENIADNGGLKQAFKAYRNWVKKQGEEEQKLPGLDLTNNQLFFLNFAQIWCGTARPEALYSSIASGRHSPGRERVIGSVSNSPDFAKAFSCKAGDRMNPTSKCRVW
ncbi:unnamed protein product [Owenia fusiformis]|uniref:Uncharacterized protein n=1 Tax=Owenia fusiformis TaxID=6347 RepID=A0A8S4N3E2_OWEFU|nr:unnamed protein product [Owenia fusiformis]